LGRAVQCDSKRSWIWLKSAIGYLKTCRRSISLREAAQHCSTYYSLTTR